MIKAVARRANKPINRALRLFGLELVRAGRRQLVDYRDYIPLGPVMAAAEREGLSVGDYVDGHHNVRGATQETIDRLQTMGVLRPGVRRVCEIGPGTGRYLQRVIAICRPERYEIYETSEEWRSFLVERFPVVARPTDGKSLSATPDRSIDLVHAHKVFPGTPFLFIRRYMEEMARVVAPGGKIVFDAVTEECMDDETVARWFESGWGYQAYPNMVPRQYVVSFFAQRGLAFEGSFFVAMKPGKTECLTFAMTS